MPNPVIILKEEPLTSVFQTWASWVAVMIVFIILLTYLLGYFTKSNTRPIKCDSLRDMSNVHRKRRFETTPRN